MGEVDTKTQVAFVATAQAPSKYSSYERAVRNFSYAAIAQHNRYAMFEAALAKADVSKWTLYDILEADDNDPAKRIFLEYFDDDPSRLFPNTTEGQLQSTVPKEVIDAYMPRVDEIRKEQEIDSREFARRLTNNFVAQLRRQRLPLPADLENRIQPRVTGVVGDIIRTSKTLAEVENKVKNYLVGTLAFFPETQPLVASEQPTLEEASREAISGSESTIVNLMTRPQVLTQTVGAPVLDKQSFETILTGLVAQTPSVSVSRHAQTAQMLTRTLESTRATVAGVDAARAAGDLLVALAKQSDKPLGAAIASILNPQTRDRIFEAIVNNSWEKTIDGFTKKTAGLVLDQGVLQDVISRANRAFGVSSGKSAQVGVRNVAGDLFGSIFGSPTDAMQLWVKSQMDLTRLNASLPAHLRVLEQLAPSGGPIPLFSTRAEFFIALLYVTGSPLVSAQPSEEKGGILRFVLSFGLHEGKGYIIRQGLSAAAARTSGSTIGRFLGFLTSIFGTRAGSAAGAAAGGAAGAAVGTGIMPIIGTILGFIGGSLIMPALNWFGGIFGRFTRGEIGPWGAATTGIGGYVRDALGGAYGQARQWYDNPLILLPVVIIVIILLPILPILNTTFTPIPQITLQDAALLTNYDKAGGAGQEEYIPGNYFANIDLTNLGPFDCFSPTSTGITTGNGQSQPLSSSQAEKVRGAIASTPSLSLYSCVLGCGSSKVNTSAFPYSNINTDVYATVDSINNPDNIIWWSNAFKNSDEALAANMAHELAHILNQRRPEIFDAYLHGTTSSPRAYCGKLGTYPDGLNESESETFAEAARLYLTDNGILKKLCPQSVDFFDSLFLQCK